MAQRQLRRQLDGRLREHVEQLEPEARAERLRQPPRDLRRPLVSELGGSLQVVLERLRMIVKFIVTAL